MSLQPWYSDFLHCHAAMEPDVHLHGHLGSEAWAVAKSRATSAKRVNSFILIWVWKVVWVGGLNGCSVGVVGRTFKTGL